MAIAIFLSLAMCGKTPFTLNAAAPVASLVVVVIVVYCCCCCPSSSAGCCLAALPALLCRASIAALSPCESVAREVRLGFQAALMAINKNKRHQ